MKKQTEWENPRCVECGCIGNMSCGYEPVNEEWLCALDQTLTCGCCNEKTK